MEKSHINIIRPLRSAMTVTGLSLDLNCLYIYICDLILIIIYKLYWTNIKKCAPRERMVKKNELRLRTVKGALNVIIKCRVNKRRYWPGTRAKIYDTKESREPRAIRISYFKKVQRLRTIYGKPGAEKRNSPAARRNRDHRYFNKSTAPGVFVRPLS